MKKFQSIVVSIFLLFNLCSAGIVNKTLWSTHGTQDLLPFIITDFEANPSVILPQKTTFCTNEEITPSIEVQSDWYSDTYNA
ncbi:MAG: hypothetical protein N3G22_00545, partial [Candidatus Micrarchaeota archaeon]|nr:hypothetical protein [Candidatus Micrarchaeota archaeon]